MKRQLPRQRGSVCRNRQSTATIVPPSCAHAPKPLAFFASVGWREGRHQSSMVQPIKRTDMPDCTSGIRREPFRNVQFSKTTHFSRSRGRHSMSPQPTRQTFSAPSKIQFRTMAHPPRTAEKHSSASSTESAERSTHSDCTRDGSSMWMPSSPAPMEVTVGAEGCRQPDVLIEFIIC